MSRFHPLVLSLIALLPATAQPERRRDGPPRFHDPSTPVRDGRTWYVASTGRGVVMRHSTDLEKWEDGPRVFTEPPAWHREMVPDNKSDQWAPDLIKVGNRYLLYYSVSSWGKNVSAIGLASTPTLDPASRDYKWKDEGMVIRSTREDPYNAIDPQLFADDDGKLWMVFGSFWTGIQLVELDPKSGLVHPQRKKVRQLAWNETIEAAALLKHDGHYYLFVNWGLCCRGVNSTYEMRVGRSKKITGPYVDAEGKEMATGGGTVFFKTEGDRIGPGHPAFVTEKDKVRMFFHYYDAKRGGTATLGEVPLRWKKDGWPEI